MRAAIGRAPWKSLPSWIDFILHVDKHPEAFVVTLWRVGVCTAVHCFVETGVARHALPAGRSPCSSSGALCGAGLMEFAPRRGCAVRSCAGRPVQLQHWPVLGPKVFQSTNSVQPLSLDQAHAFMRALWRYHHCAGPLHVLYPHFCSVCGGCGSHGPGVSEAPTTWGTVLGGGHLHGRLLLYNPAWVREHSTRSSGDDLYPGLIASLASGVRREQRPWQGSRATCASAQTLSAMRLNGDMTRVTWLANTASPAARHPVPP